ILIYPYPLSLKGLPERLRSETEPVSSYRFSVEEINHKGVKKGNNYIFMPRYSIELNTIIIYLI
ncbi:hypothetical protein BpHYR1_012226, partial [Brachionus plicatilis]